MTINGFYQTLSVTLTYCLKAKYFNMQKVLGARYRLDFGFIGYLEDASLTLFESEGG
ncbi:hypothetical protein JCM19240_52 [Vibrio maritimus]|uniref:Uncharacterized protein n=1 Tax=Vibrio maritimus TaxID=990268 RepID=A0A090TE36_9VIBR|nr:hypothetical protein JCM19240_52 [Vibrio maritimus]